MIVAGPILVGAPKNRPLTDQRCRCGRGEEEVSQQMTYFGGSQSNERGRGSGRRIFCWCGKRVRSLQADAYQKGIRQQHKGDVYVIQNTALSPFVVISLIEHPY